jgi:hypothetical protein
VGEQGGGIDGDLFGHGCIIELADILGIKRNDPRLPAFRDELRNYGTKRRHDIQSMPVGFPIAPFDASLTQRIEWLSTQVIGPAERLLDALDGANRPYFSEWPDEYRLPDRPHLDSAHEPLNTVREHAIALRDNLEGQLSQKIAHTSEMRYDIVTVLIDILKEHFPDIRRSRGQYDSQLRATVGAIPDYVRRAFFEITGSTEQLDAPIQQALAKPRKTQLKSG